MKNAFLFFPFLLLIFVLGCGDEETTIINPPMMEEEPEPEPTSLRTGLLFHAPFAGNADDIAFSGLTGSVTGATITTDRHGKENEAYYFDGADDFINYGAAPNLALGAVNPYTMTAWVKLEERDDTQRHYIVSKWNGGVNAAWYLSVNSSKEIQAYRHDPPWSVKGAPEVPYDEYVHIASTYDGTDLQVWLNGEMSGTIPFGRTTNDRVTEMLIGGIFSQNEVVPTLMGTIDDVRIYNRLLTTEELTWLATN